MARVAIVGGGVIGCAIAERLTRASHQVVLLERDHIGAHASGAAAGLLAAERELPDPRTAAASGDLFPELTERIERESGIAVEYRHQEALALAVDDLDRQAMADLGGHWHDPAEAHRLEPVLTTDLVGAALLWQAQVTPPRFVEALARTAMAAGADIREGTPVIRLLSGAAGVEGVEVPGERIRADWVIVAAGPWSGHIAASAGLDVAVEPRRGQLVALRPPKTRLSRILTWRACYLVPKPDGSVVVGSTEEVAGFDARPTASGIGEMLEVARRLVPDLAHATVERVWAALRPVTPSGTPLVGQAGGHPNLLLATGHGRHGILLAPATAVAIADAIRR
jgi:glycine oxidase